MHNSFSCAVETGLVGIIDLECIFAWLVTKNNPFADIRVHHMIELPP